MQAVVSLTSRLLLCESRLGHVIDQKFSHYQFHSKSVKIDDLRTARHRRYAVTDTEYGGNSKKAERAKLVLVFHCTMATLV